MNRVRTSFTVYVCDDLEIVENKNNFLVLIALSQK